MTTPAPDLLGWGPDTSVSGPGWDEASPEQRQAAQVWAVHTLWALSGRRFALVTRRVAPYLAPRRPNAYAERSRYAGGSLLGVWGGCAAPTVRLPGPLADVLAVEIGGAPLPSTSWTLDPDGTLVRTDGGGWPIGQDVYAPTPVWIVTGLFGTPPTAAANVAAGRYAGELLRASKGQPCSVPIRARSISRPGLTIDVPDPAVLTEAGRTGSPEVDRWLASVNPEGLAESATVSSPDLARHRFLT